MALESRRVNLTVTLNHIGEHWSYYRDSRSENFILNKVLIRDKGLFQILYFELVTASQCLYYPEFRHTIKPGNSLDHFGALHGDFDPFLMSNTV